MKTTNKSIKALQAITLVSIGCTLIGGLYATSCVVEPDPDRTLPCGIAWHGVFSATVEDSQTLQLEEIEGNGLDVCMSAAHHAALVEGVDAGCHLIADEQECVGCCEWGTVIVHGRSADVCVFKNDLYQEAFLGLVETADLVCEGIASAQMFNAYPCELIANVGTCNAIPYCTWAFGACAFDYDNCATGAARIRPATSDEPCRLPANECADGGGETGGGGPGGGTGCEIPGEGTTSEGELPDPGDVITSVGNNTYEIDAAFWAFITQPENQPLLLVDDAHFVQGTMGPVWNLVDVDPSSYAYALGLRNNDHVYQLNGYGLASVEDVMAAITAVASATTFTLKFKRLGVWKIYTYNIV